MVMVLVSHRKYTVKHGGTHVGATANSLLFLFFFFFQILDWALAGS